MSDIHEPAKAFDNLRHVDGTPDIQARREAWVAIFLGYVAQVLRLLPRMVIEDIWSGKYYSMQYKMLIVLLKSATGSLMRDLLRSLQFPWMNRSLDISVPSTVPSFTLEPFENWAWLTLSLKDWLVPLKWAWQPVSRSDFPPLEDRVTIFQSAGSG